MSEDSQTADPAATSPESTETPEEMASDAPAKTEPETPPATNGADASASASSAEVSAEAAETAPAGGSEKANGEADETASPGAPAQEPAGGSEQSDGEPGETETASSEEPDSGSVAGEDAATDQSDEKTAGGSEARKSVEGEDPRHELRELMELAVKYPEIGPPLAELAFKVGHSDIGERVLKMGLSDDETTGVEFYAVAVDVARREGRYEEVFEQVEDALATFAETADDAVTDDEANRLLHLVRNGFAVLLFDLEDVNSRPDWVETLQTQLPRLQERYAEDPFYFCLLAQAYWFSDKEKSEATWEKAIELSDGDFAWNARGTWYKDAASDFEAAEAAYRKGLDKSPESALLLHNLAQLLTDEAEKRSDDDPGQARMWLKEADELVRKALRQQTRRGLRRYIHGTKDRVRKQLKKLPLEEIDPPNKGDVLKGRVVAVVKYGAFITIRGGFKGLLHISEIAHEHVRDPEQYATVGDEIRVKVISVKPQDDGSLRIGLSRKALIDKPDTKSGSKSSKNKRKKGKKGNKGKSGKKGSGRKKHGGKGDGIGTLGEMLLAKLEEAKDEPDKKKD